MAWCAIILIRMLLCAWLERPLLLLVSQHLSQQLLRQQPPMRTTTIRPVNMIMVMTMEEEMATEMDLVPRDIRVPVLEMARKEALNPVPMMDLRAVEMDKAVAATPKVTRDLVPDRVRRDIKVPGLMMDLVPRDTREAVDTEIAMEMEAVPRDIRVLVPVTAMETEAVLKEAQNLGLTMDTLEAATMEEMAVDLDPRDTRVVALEMVTGTDLVPRVPARVLDLILMMVTLEVATVEEMVVDLAITTVVDPY